jgi:lysylphosphatidylglycerol synthetase-like protein (DUF2156 family)
MAGGPLLYEVGYERLHLYLDLGLSLFKLGEEARVPLAEFSLEGSARKGLRYTQRKMEKAGCRLAVFPLYNFQGLRQYKNKFDPVWRPKYLASPGGLALPRVFANLAALISGSIRGAVVK